MKEAKYFDSFELLQEYIVNEKKPFINLRECEIVASNEKHTDERIGWIDSDYLCIDSYENVSDKSGYIRFFGGKYNCPQCIGMFATQWIGTGMIIF